MKKILFVLIFFLFCAKISFAANTGEISPDGPSSANESSATTNWTNTGTSPVDSVGTSNDAYCVYTGTTLDSLYVINFNMAIPAGATIDSIFATLEAQGSATQAARRRLAYFFVKDGTVPVGEISAVNNFPQDVDGTQRMTGVTTPLWNTTWSAAEINASTFGIVLWKTATQAGNVSLDHVTIYVAFTEVGGAKGSVMSSGLIN